MLIFPPFRGLGPAAVGIALLVGLLMTLVGYEMIGIIVMAVAALVLLLT